MSRTRKDRPYFVMLTDRTIRRREHHDHRAGICDLDPQRHDRTIRRRFDHYCYMSLSNERYYGSTPKWFRDHVWTNAERVRERDDLRAIAKAHRGADTHGAESLEDLYGLDFPSWQARHCARWLYT